jgi:hypothetical protein
VTRLRARHAATVCVLVVVAASAGSVRAAQPAGVTWAGKHFASQREFSEWLSARGIAYRDWQARHPRGAYLLTHPRAPVPKPAPAPTLLPPPPAAASSSRVLYVVLPLALLFVLVGLLPLGRLEGLRPALPAVVLARTLEIRVVAFACAAALVVALLLTRALG